MTAVCIIEEKVSKAGYKRVEKRTFTIAKHRLKAGTESRVLQEGPGLSMTITKG